MRIIGEIDHPILKITAFKMNDKVSVKLEHELIEHIIKFRDGSGIENIDDVNAFLTKDILDDVIKSIINTASKRGKRLLEMKDSNLDHSLPKIL